MTATAKLADVVLPTANLYEKSGTVTNTFGDLQQVKKAADRAGVRSGPRVESFASPIPWEKMCAYAGALPVGRCARHGPIPGSAIG